VIHPRISSWMRWAKTFRHYKTLAKQEIYLNEIEKTNA